MASGIIIADTKFEFGVLPDGRIILIDEILTPDSFRLWPTDMSRGTISPASTSNSCGTGWKAAVE